MDPLRPLPVAPATARLHPLLFLLPLAFLTLACMTAETGMKIAVGPDGAEQYTVRQSVELSPAYLAAARQANQDLAADHVAAGRAAPKDLFPTGSLEMFAEGAADRRAEGATVTETATGLTSTKTEPLEDLLARIAGETEPVVQVDRTDPDAPRYVVQLTIPAMDFDLDSLDRMRREGIGDKPAIETIDPSKVADEEGLINGAIAALAKWAGGEAIALDEWYSNRVMVAAGLPVFRYEIELPGEILLAEVDGKPAGTVSGAIFALVVDEAFLRRFGTSEHYLRVESAAGCQNYCQVEFDKRQPEGLTFDAGTGTYPDSCTCWCSNSDAERVPCWEGDCAADCAARFDHGIWDGTSEHPDCECICDKGWEMRDAVCLACEAICKADDARASHDPAASQPNDCACKCSGELMRYEDGKGCTCVPGAVPAAGDKCVCPPGFEPSVHKDHCVEAEAKCEPGMNCATHPDRCQCEPSLICDPWSPYADPSTCCGPKMAYIIVSSDADAWGLTDYERLAVAGRRNLMRDFYRDLGYQVKTINVHSLNGLAEVLARPATAAIAVFGHGAEGPPNLEGANAAALQAAVATVATDRYRAIGVDATRAQQLGEQRANNINLDYAYLNVCYSFSDSSLRDLLMKRGGVFWGEANLANAHGSRIRSVRP